MGGINLSSVIKGGLLAGLLINVSEYILNMYVVPIGGDDAGGSIAVWVVYAFVLGLLIAWMVAALRPRFGSGPKEAMCAGVTVWILHTLLPAIGVANMGLMDFNVLALVWTLVEMGLAGAIAGHFYSED